MSATTQMSNPETVKANIQLVRSLSNELAGYLYTLPEDIWRDAETYASACEMWKVADVVTHLISGALMYSLSLESALQGDPSPPMGYRRQSATEDIESLISMRSTLGEDLFFEFNVTCSRLNNLLASLGPDDNETMVWHPARIIPASRLIDYRVLELAVHGWDIRYGLDRSATLSPGAVPFLKDWMWRWFRAGFQRNDAFQPPIRYRFQLTEPDRDSYDVVITGDDFRLNPSEDVQADVTFRCDEDTYILFGMGRLPFARSVRRGRLSYDGDEQVAARFTDWFKPL